MVQGSALACSQCQGRAWCCKALMFEMLVFAATACGSGASFGLGRGANKQNSDHDTLNPPSPLPLAEEPDATTNRQNQLLLRQLGSRRRGSQNPRKPSKRRNPTPLTHIMWQEGSGGPEMLGIPSSEPFLLLSLISRKRVFLLHP